MIYNIYINSIVITDFVNLQFTTFNLLFVLLYCLHFPKKNMITFTMYYIYINKYYWKISYAIDDIKKMGNMNVKYVLHKYYVFYLYMNYILTSKKILRNYI